MIALAPDQIMLQMARLFLLLSLILILMANTAAPMPGQSEQAPKPDAKTGELKFGKINIQEMIASSAEGKSKFNALQHRFKPVQDKLAKQNDEIENLKKQLAAQGDRLSEEQRRRRTTEIETKTAALKQDYEQANSQFQQAKQEVVNQIGDRTIKLLGSYAKEHGYAVIFDLSTDQPDVLWASQEAVRIASSGSEKGASTPPQLEALRARFVNEKAIANATDITKDMIAAYNKQFPLTLQ